MADGIEVARELDRLFTTGHQDSSLMSAIHKRFPDVTQAEFDQAANEVIADRRRRVERMKRELAERTGKVPEE